MNIPVTPVHTPHGALLRAWWYRVLLRSRRPVPRPAAAPPTIYRIVYRLHERRTAHVTADDIAATVSAWMAELGVHTPMSEELARAVRTGDWPAVHAIGRQLSVEVTVAGRADTLSPAPWGT
jgi:hypothetical protein